MSKFRYLTFMLNNKTNFSYGSYGFDSFTSVDGFGSSTSGDCSGSFTSGHGFGSFPSSNFVIKQPRWPSEGDAVGVPVEYVKKK